MEKFAYTRLVGVALGLLAIIFLVAPTASLPDRTQLPWVVLALGSGACYTALNIILSLKKPPGLDSAVVTCGMFTAAAVTMVPIVVIAGSFAPLAWPFGPIEYSMLGLGLISFIAYTLYLHLIHHAGPVFTSQVANLLTLMVVASIIKSLAAAIAARRAARSRSSSAYAPGPTLEWLQRQPGGRDI